MSKAITRRNFLKTTAVTTAAISMHPIARAAKAPDRPNVIFILTDDLGWGDPKCFGHPFMKTPNIDRLAEQGAVFTQFYVNNPVCSPSRTAFMTGHFPARHRVHQHFAKARQNKARNMPNWLDPKAPMITRLLKNAGYATGHFGKWHLSSMTIKDAPLPKEYGIDDCATRRTRPKWRGRIPYYRAKSTGIFVDETLRFIRARAGKPFYVNLWTLVPHATLKPTPEELKEYENLKVDEKQFTGYMRKYLAEAPELNPQMKIYCAAVTGMDKAIGRLMDELEKMGLADNTLIFFTSDNGPEDYHVKNAANAGAGSTGVFRGRKRSIYEGGVRTPLIARWPGKIKAGRRDQQSVITAVDWLPTICKLAGAKVGDIKPDGEDVSDILTGAPRERTKPIFWEWRGGIAGDQTCRPPKLAVREGKWKFLINHDGSRAELYDIPADCEERTNLADKHPAIAKLLKSKLLAWSKTLPK